MQKQFYIKRFTRCCLDDTSRAMIDRDGQRERERERERER